MAKSISTPNIAVTVNASDVKPKISNVNKALAELSGKPIVDLKNTIDTSFTEINKDIKSTVENLYKLRAELAKGGDPSKLTKQLQGQLDRINTKSGGKSRGLDLKDAAGDIDDIFGGKFKLNKGAKFGIAGIVASLASDMLAGVTDGLVKAKDAGGSFGDYTKEIGNSLPIIGGIVKTVENIHELWTGVRAEAAQYNSILELQNKASENHNKSLERTKQLAKDTARAIAQQVEAFGASLRGGVGGEVLRINADAAGQTRDLAGRRDDAVTKIEANRDELLKANSAALAKAKTPDQRAKLEANAKVINSDAEREIAAQNTAYAQQLSVIEAIRSKRSLIAQGLTEDTKAVEDQLDSLAKQTRTMSGDPLEAMRKSFLELKPSAENLGEFNKQLARYKERVKEVEAEQRKISATKNAEEIVRRGSALAGLDDKDRQLQELIEAGVTDQALLAKVKVVLDDIEAKNAAKALKETLLGIGASVSASLARTLRERVDAEVAETARKMKLNEEQTAQLRDARLNEEYAKAAAQTREAAKSPTDRLNESIDSLKEQFERGFINEAEMANAVGNSVRGFSDSQRTNRPDLIEAGSAAAQQALAIGSGQVIDASRPELTIAKEQKALLSEIRDAIKEQRPVTVSIGG